MTALRWLLALAKPYRGRLTLASIALVGSGGVSLVVPAVAGQVVDAALTKHDTRDLDQVILGLVGLFLVSSGLGFVESYALRSAAANLLQDLRAKLHAHLLDLSPAFFESQRTGDLLSRLGSDVDQVGSVLTREIVSGLQQVIVLVGALVILLGLNAGLTGLMLALVPPVIVAAVLFGLRFEKLSKAEREAVAHASVAAEEAIAGIRTVQSFTREPEERARYKTRLEEATRVSLRAARTWGAFGAVVSFLAFSALALVLWYGGRLVIRGDLTAGKLTSFLLYTLSVAGAVGSLTSLWGSLKTAAGASERVRDILATEPKVKDAADAIPLERAKGHVVFENVRFSYPTAESSAEPKQASGSEPRCKVRTAVDGASIEVEPGKVLALVGPSGAGKSTLAALLLRFHDVDEGAVKIDGTDVRRYRLRDLRRGIGLVPQELFLFGDTVGANIRVGKPGATDDEVKAAAEAAQAHAFIDRLPQGYASLVGERGVKLSAGERQRIAIARVILEDPGIVLLDEATSALDAESEHLVQKAFERLLVGRTTIVIAHRLATVKRASKVVLLQHGKVAEEGTHDELLARGGLYRRLCELQMLDASS